MVGMKNCTRRSLKDYQFSLIKKTASLKKNFKCFHAMQPFKVKVLSWFIFENPMTLVKKQRWLFFNGKVISRFYLTIHVHGFYSESFIVVVSLQSLSFWNYARIVFLTLTEFIMRKRVKVLFWNIPSCLFVPKMSTVFL